LLNSKIFGREDSRTCTFACGSGGAKPSHPANGSRGFGSSHQGDGDNLSSRQQTS